MPHLIRIISRSLLLGSSLHSQFGQNWWKQAVVSRVIEQCNHYDAAIKIINVSNLMESRNKNLYFASYMKIFWFQNCSHALPKGDSVNDNDLGMKVNISLKLQDLVMHAIVRERISCSSKGPVKKRFWKVCMIL